MGWGQYSEDGDDVGGDGVGKNILPCHPLVSSGLFLKVSFFLVIGN